uniref:Malectin-like domain-containing protein n=1 Tax=Aegilops tauschii subsp. strangulata TaxID=200361 RepID=A0A453KNH5_AEGTS
MVLPGYYLNMYYTDFQEQRLRAFDVYYNGYLWVPNNLSITPNYLFSDYSNATAPFTDNSGFYNVRIIATNTSVLPPMLNAYEINYLIQHDDTATDTQDGMYTSRSPKVSSQWRRVHRIIVKSQFSIFQAWEAK